MIVISWNKDLSIISNRITRLIFFNLNILRKNTIIRYPHIRFILIND